ncbi:DUF58 domain-containing protein [Sulfurovum sp. ST-21]|uniref:DUF58 domain-containing protein n=1 Tax=Sulfurovum indicum TaxID=2779528 RepID=A0A7M1S3I6_9BACT|nr:DUF58 domain-containing protein [Sulfurovum indicum]QOR61886.1 DUF58 domain-containing protein [Sulfurovum indicum]
MSSSFKALQLKARHQVYTLLSGHNLSRLHGEGYDFAELREYQMGDDIRKINWTVTAKLGKPYIKELHANRELSVVVSVLMDGGVYFGAGNAKQKTMTEVASLLGYATQHNNDLFSGLLYTKDQIYMTPPTKQLFEIEHFSEQIHSLEVLHSQLDLQASIDDLFKRIHKPSLLFILHDFLTPVDLSLLAQRHEVIAVVIREREEEFPGEKGEIIMQDPRSGTKFNTYFGKRSVTRYLARREANDEKILEHFSQYDIRYIKIFTDEESVEKLISLFR